jgi:hypothetical protein
MPGLLDLPQDVLRVHIAPYLSNIHDLNEVLPKSLKVIRKFSKKFAWDHHFDLLKNKFKILICRCDEIQTEKRYTLIHRVVQDLGNPFSLPLLTHKGFKETVINKLIEFQDYEIYLAKPPISKKWFTMFQKCCKRTLAKIVDL